MSPRAEFYEAARLRLGHDPLREDADAEALWEKVRVSKKPIGGILMDQTMIAGVGNIYRAEILFKVGRWWHGPCASLECSLCPAADKKRLMEPVSRRSCPVSHSAQIAA